MWFNVRGSRSSLVVDDVVPNQHAARDGCWREPRSAGAPSAPERSGVRLRFVALHYNREFAKRASISVPKRRSERVQPLGLTKLT